MASAVPPKILTLQAGRALAALAVVLFHVRVAVESFIGPIPSSLSQLFAHGFLGVDFFFVLSGFIIYHTNSGSQPGTAWAHRYLRGRLIRIFVPYLPIGIGMALIYTFIPTLSASERDWNWFTTLTLLPSTAEPALNVAWTLRHELVFYAIFGIAFLVGRPIEGVALWSCGIVFVLLIGGSKLADGPLLGAINLEFLFGMIAAANISSARHRSRYLVAAGSSCLLLFFLLGLDAKEGTARILFGLGVALFLVPILRLEFRGTITVPSWLVLLGEASYAVYLVHNPVISVMVRIAPSHWPVAAAMCCIAGVGAGLAYHLGFERRAIGWTKPWSRGAGVSSSGS